MEVKLSKAENWYLADEITYLQYLGTGHWCRNVTMGRADLLRSYIATVGQRTEPWVSKARREAERLLQEELKT